MRFVRLLCFVCSDHFVRSGHWVRFCRGVASGVAILVTAGAAGAALRPFTGRLAFELPGRAPLAVTGVGLATVNPSDPGPSLQELRIRGGVTGTAILPITDPIVTQGGLNALQAEVSLGSGTLGPFHPPVASTRTQLTRPTLPLAGWLRMCLFEPDCQSARFSLALSRGSGSTGIGAGGLLTAGGAGDLRVSALAAPWTVKTVSLPIQTPGGASVSLQATGSVHGPASLTGSTAESGGSLSLVTPLRTVSDEGQPLTSFSRLTLYFLPEPSWGAAVAAGAALLAVMGFARRGASLPRAIRGASGEERS